MAVAGLVVAAALGFAIAKQSALEVVEGQASAQINSADIRFQQEAAEIAAERQALLQQATTGVVPKARSWKISTGPRTCTGPPPDLGNTSSRWGTSSGIVMSGLGAYFEHCLKPASSATVSLFPMDFVSK